MKATIAGAAAEVQSVILKQKRGVEVGEAELVSCSNLHAGKNIRGSAATDCSSLSVLVASKQELS